MQSLLVVYDDPSAIYQPGSTVSGTVEIVAEKNLKVESIKLEVLGEAWTSFTSVEQKWRLTKQGKRERYRVSNAYSERNNYIDLSLLIWTPARGSKYLEEGSHTIPFSFVLPKHCGPSYEGTYGYIRYYCKAKLDVPWGFDKKSKTAFTVMPVYDLNSIPGALFSAFEEATENIGVSIFKHGFVTLKVSLSKRGYISGEPITANIWISNGSSRVIQKIELKLKQMTKYSAFNSLNNKRGTTEDTRTVYMLEKSISVPAHQTSSFDVMAPVPIMPPTFSDCPLISVAYELHVKIYAKGNLNNTVKVALPVIIGTTPKLPPSVKTLPIPASSGSVIDRSITTTGRPASFAPEMPLPPAIYQPPPSSAPVTPSAPPLPSAPPAESFAPYEPPPPYESFVYNDSFPQLQGKPLASYPKC